MHLRFNKYADFINLLLFWKMGQLTFPAMCWKFRSTEVIRAVNIFHFLSILPPKKDQTAHFFHCLMMSGLKWNFCLFEQEGTGINYKGFFPSFHIQFFSGPPGANTGLDAFNVYLTRSSPTPHWIHSLWTPCYHSLEAFFLHDHILLWHKLMYYHFYTYFRYCFCTLECLMEVLFFCM